MPQLFGHEKLEVYQKGMQFAVLRISLVSNLDHKVAACDHLVRATESILINIAHANSTWFPKERIVYLGHANGSALECSACLDILVAKNLLVSNDVYKSKLLLVEIVSMLIAMHKIAFNRICEEPADYRTKKDRFFKHENLDVYQVSLQLITWLETILTKFSCSADLKAKLDKSTTAISLNIAEGTGRFSSTDQIKFYKIAYKAAIQSAALIDIASIRPNTEKPNIEVGHKLIHRIASMLSALSKTP